MAANRTKDLAKGYLIDPEAKKITHVRHDTKDYRQIYDIIDCHPSPFTVVHLDDHDVIFVDDEGLLKNPRYFFNIKGYPQPIAGKGLVLGGDSQGETVSANIEYEELCELITFSEHSVKDMVTTESKAPGGGFIIKTEPVFGPPEKTNGKAS